MLIANIGLLCNADSKIIPGVIKPDRSTLKIKVLQCFDMKRRIFLTSYVERHIIQVINNLLNTKLYQ